MGGRAGRSRRGQGGRRDRHVYRYFPSKADLCAEIVATVSAREVEIVKAVATPTGRRSRSCNRPSAPSQAARCSGRRLAYALIAEPVDPEVETVRLDYRAQLAHGFERILREGIMRGVFPRLDPAVAAACIVGAFMEALVGPLAPAKGRARAPIGISSSRSRNSACAPASALRRPNSHWQPVRPRGCRRCRPMVTPRTR